MLTTGRNTVRSHRGLGACHMGTAPGDGGSGPSRIGEGTELDRLGTFMTKAEMEVDETWQQWNPLLRGSQLRFQYRGVTIDLLLPRDRHDQAIFRRRQKKRLGRQYCWVVSSEDFILQNLKFGRPRDFEDVISVVTRVGDKLNRKYLRQWAGRLGVTAELDYILKL